MINTSNVPKLFLILIAAGLFSSFSAVLAQTDGSVQPDATSSAPTSQSAATSTTTSTSSLQTQGQQASSSTTTIPRESVQPTSSVPAVAPSFENPAISTSRQAQDTPSPQNQNRNIVLWAVVALVAVLPFGYLIAGSLKHTKTKESAKEDPGCFNIKKLLDKKLEELTDLRSKLETKVQDTAREKIRSAVQGTVAGKILLAVEKAEEEYERLKKLYEKCELEFKRSAFKGVIVENSLRDRSILDNVRVERTYQKQDKIIHNVFIKKDQISELSKYLAVGPWYIYLWRSGEDDATVVFKDKIFRIKPSDKLTWADTIAYGRSIDIPDEQLDFSIK